MKGLTVFLLLAFVAPLTAQTAGEMYRAPYRNVHIDSVASNGRVYYCNAPGSEPPSIVGRCYSATRSTWRSAGWILTSAPTPPPPPNQPPTAAFTFACTHLLCSFTDTSHDTDGVIAGRSWSFGATAVDPVYTFAAAGTYPVALTVTDDDGAHASATQDVTVAAAPPPPPPPSGPSQCDDPSWTRTLVRSDGSSRYYGQPPAPSPGFSYSTGGYNFGALYTQVATSDTTPGVKEVVDPASPTGKAIQKNHPKSSPQGFNGMVSVSYGQMREFCLRMTLMYSPGWQPLPDKWFYFGSPQRRALFYLGLSPSQTLQLHVQNTDNGIVVGPDGPSGWSGVYRTNKDVQFGIYNTLEVHAIAQSAPGVADAAFFVWYNGQYITGWQAAGKGIVLNELTNLLLFDSGTTNLERMNYGGFQEFIYWGGSGTKTQHDWVRQAEFVVKGK